MRLAFALFVSVFAFFSVSAVSAAIAEDAAKPAVAGDSGAVLGDPDGPLTPEEKAEKEARKACKVDLCRAFHSKDASGPDIACHVIKSWRKEQLVKLVSKVNREHSIGFYCRRSEHVHRQAMR